MSIFFDEDTALKPQIDTTWSKGSRTDLFENTAAAFKAFRRTEITTSEINNLEEEYINMVSILNKAGHSDFISPLDPGNYFVDDIEIAPKREEMEVDFWRRVNELQTTDENLKSLLTDAGLNTYDSMQATISKKAHSAWSEYQNINERATTGGKIGGFAGIAGGAFTDPLMQMAVVASFGYSIPETIGAAALRVAYMEAIIGGVTETMIQLKTQPYRAELGFEDAGLETGLKNIGMVTAASGVLSPALYGVFKAFGKGVDVGKKHLFKIPVEDLQKLQKEIGEINPKFKDKSLNEHEIPKSDNPYPDSAAGKTEHRERLDATVKSVNNNEPLDLPLARNKIDEKSVKPERVEFNDITASNPGIKKTYNSIKDLKKKIDAEQSRIKSTRDNEIKLVKKEIDRLEQVLKNPNKINIKDYIIAQENLKIAKAKLNTLNKTPEKINEVKSESGFNKKETDLAEDINYVKEFDNPTDVVLKKQTDQLRDTFAKNMDTQFPVGVKVDESSGELTSIFKSGKEIFDEEMKDIKMLNHIKKCAKL